MITDPHFLFTFRRLSVGIALFFVLLLAGCGDVQGETEDALTLRIDGRGSSYLAVQDGVRGEASVWRPLTAGAVTPHQLTLTDPQGRYGVLSVCLDAATGNLSVNLQYGVVFQTPVVSADCLLDETPATVSVSGEVTGLVEGEYGNVYLGRVSALVDGTEPRHQLELPAARYDLVASRYEGTERVPSRLVLEPGLPVTEAREIDVDFRGPFSFSPEVVRLSIDGVRNGELLSGSVELVTRGGTVARVGEYEGGEVLFYARIPAGLNTIGLEAAGRGATLRAEVQSFSYNDRTKAGSSRSISRTLPNMTGEPVPKEPATIKLPRPIASPELVLHGDPYLRPRADWQAHPAGGGTYTQFYSQVRDGHTVSYRISRHSAWLAGRPLSYLLPDFSALPDWQLEWNLTRAEALFWDVSFTQKTLLKELFTSRSGVLTP